MSQRSVWLLVTGIVALFAIGWRLHSSADDQVRAIPDTIPTAGVDVSGPLMLAKLSASQRVLEGLINRDLATVSTSAKILQELAEADPRDDGEQEDRIYEHFRADFVRLAKELDTMAGEGNLPGAAYAHQNLTATCIACHAYLRDASREDANSP